MRRRECASTFDPFVTLVLDTRYQYQVRYYTTIHLANNYVSVIRDAHVHIIRKILFVFSHCQKLMKIMN